MRIWSLFRKIIPVLVIAAMLSSFSSVVPVAAAGATHLVITTPATTVAGAVINPAITVSVQRDDNSIDTAYTSPVTIALDANTYGGSLHGTATVNAVAGVATFSTLSIDTPGTGYTLTASSGSLISGTTSPFNINVGLPTHLISTTPSNTVAGSPINPAVVVTVKDFYNNTVDSSDPISIAVSTPPSGVTLSGTTTINASHGVATFSDLSIAKAGTGYKLTATDTPLIAAVSNTFNITVGAAAKLAITTQPTNTAQNTNITPSVTVAVQDVAGNTVTTSTAPITLAIGTDPLWGTLTGGSPVNAVNGVATFSNLQINNVHAGYVLVASSGALTTAPTNAFTIFGPANKLAFTVQPPSVAAGATLLPAVVVTIQDAAGNTIANSAASVTIALGNNPGSATLGGTLSVTAANGVATFSNLTVNKPGTGYTLAATSSPLALATSTSFDITIGTATKLAITAQPSNTAATTIITPPVKVTVQDVVGNTVDSTASITLAFGNNAGGSGSILGGTVTVPAVHGVATFSDLTINNPGTGYTLTATGTSLTPATTTAFNVFGPAASLVITAQPGNTAVSANITPAVTVTARDAAGITVYNYILPITMAIGTNPGTGALGGTVTVIAANGVATFSALTINTAGAGYTLIARDGTLTSAASNAFNVFGPATKLAFGVQPAANTSAGAMITPAVTVLVQDAINITVTNSTVSVVLAIGTNPGAGTLSGTTTIAAVNGVATFNNLSIDKVGTGYTLSATNGTLTAAISNTFNIGSGAITATAISPNFGPVAGGTAVTITGTGFVSGATVTIGGTAATSIVVVSTTSITAVAPASATTGAKNVVVTTAGGSATITNGYTYIPNWWAGDASGVYTRRALLIITNQTTSILAPYEVKITVPHAVAMNANFSDVRFVLNDATNAVLNYWINTPKLVPSTSAEIWVQVPSIPASGSVTIYMYYGNVSAVTTSNIHTTFIFGDDFEDSAWTSTHIYANNVGGTTTQGIVVDGTNHAYEQSGLNSTTNPDKSETLIEMGQAGALTQFPDNYIVDLDVKPMVKAGGAYITGRYTDVSNKYEQVLTFSTDQVTVNKVVGDLWTNIGTGVSLGYQTVIGTWYTLHGTILWTGTQNILLTGVNDAPSMTPAINDNGLPATTFHGLAILSYDDTGAFDTQFDNFRVRHYADPAPIVSPFGAEQVAYTAATAAATNVAVTTATLNGSLANAVLTVPVNVSFEYGTTTSYGSTTTAAAQTLSGAFSFGVSSLTPGTPYHFRAKLDAGTYGILYGSDMPFTTSAAITTTNNPPPSGGGGGGGFVSGPSAPTTVAGVTSLTGAINTTGVFSMPVTAWSDDKKVAFVVGQNTKGVDSTGVALSQISITPMTPVPAFPAGANIIGLAYNFEPSGATFTPTVPVRFSYDPALLPTGVAEGSLKIAVYDTAAKAWITLTTTIDTANHFLFADIAHFSIYAVTYGVPAFVPVQTTTTTAPVPITTLPVITTTTPLTTTTKPAATTTTPVATTTQPAPSAAFSVGGLVITPNEISTTETATVKVTVTNKGNLAGTSIAVLKIDNNIVGTKSLLIAAGESQDAVFNVSRDTAGTYSIDVNGQSGTLTVKVPAASTPFLFKNWWIFAVIIIIVALGTVVMITSRRKSSSQGKGSAK